MKGISREMTRTVQVGWGKEEERGITCFLLASEVRKDGSGMGVE